MSVLLNVVCVSVVSLCVMIIVVVLFMHYYFSSGSQRLRHSESRQPDARTSISRSAVFGVLSALERAIPDRLV